MFRCLQRETKRLYFPLFKINNKEKNKEDGAVSRYHAGFKL